MTQTCNGTMVLGRLASGRTVLFVLRSVVRLAVHLSLVRSPSWDHVCHRLESRCYPFYTTNLEARLAAFVYKLCTTTRPRLKSYCMCEGGFHEGRSASLFDDFQHARLSLFHILSVSFSGSTFPVNSLVVVVLGQEWFFKASNLESRTRKHSPFG